MTDLLLTLMLYSAPLILAALGETVVQRSGLLNIGLEGTMLCGAFAGFMVAFSTQNIWLGLAAGTAAGLLLTALVALFSIQFQADQVVVGTAVNLLALGLTGTLFRSQFGERGQLIALPSFPKLGSVDVVMLLAIVLIPALWMLLSRTRWGLACRACGEYPQAAEASGFSVYRIRWQAMIVGGLLGGLAGAYLSLGVAGSFSENMSSGRGFVAIAMVTFGRWKPGWVVLACLLIGYLDSLQFTLQGKGIDVPYQLLLALPYLTALLVLVFFGKGAKSPAALAQPFRRGS